MQSQLVFQEEKERERLRRQNLLLSQAEKPALEHFFKGKSELSVLDIGCNDGARTFHRFSDDRISRVIGLEYNQQLVERANSQYGNTKFSFYQMDVDRDSFSADFQKLCTEPEDREFDLICLSFVLMHLHDGEKLLRTLKNFLKKVFFTFLHLPSFFDCLAIIASFISFVKLFLKFFIIPGIRYIESPVTFIDYSAVCLLFLIMRTPAIRTTAMIPATA